MDFYFNRKGFNKKTRLLTYLVNTTNYLLLITGPRKVGKTTFVDNWLSNKNNLEYNNLDNIFTTKITLDYGQEIELESIKEQCVTNWQLNVNENFVISFNDVIANIPKDTMHQYLLVIDNADRLPKNVLQELIKLNSDTDSLVFRLVLIGNNLLSDYIVNVAKGKNYKIYNFKINPLSFKETRLFLIEFYKKHNRTVPFKYKQVVDIYKKSSGIILNIIREIRSYHTPQANVKVKSKKNKINLFRNIKKLKEDISLNFINEYREVLRNISIASLGMIILGLFIFQDEINNNLSDEHIAVHENIKVATNNISDVKTDIQSNKIKSIELEQDNNKKADKQIEKIIESQPIIKREKTTKTISKINKETKIKKFKNTKDATHVLALDNNNYTIQLGAYLNKQDAISFIKKNIKNYNLRKDFKIVAAERNNKIYYLVLYGNFETNKLADNYVKIMKQSLKDNGAWIRLIASVKSDINNIKGSSFG